jgi:hypothetical protein
MKRILCVLASVVSLNAASVCIDVSDEITWQGCVDRYKPRLCVAASITRFHQEISNLCQQNILNADFDWNRINYKIIFELRTQWCRPMARTAYLSFFLTQLMRCDDDLSKPATKLHQFMQNLLFVVQTKRDMGEQWKEAIRQMNDLFEQINPYQDKNYMMLLSFF